MIHRCPLLFPDYLNTMNYLSYQEEHSTLFQPSLFFIDFPFDDWWEGEEGWRISRRGILQIPEASRRPANGRTHFHTDGIKDSRE